MNPELINIGGLSIRWYSVLILCGILIAIFLAEKEGKKRGLPKDFIFDLAFWVVIFGILGARLYFVVFNFNLYKSDMMEIFRIWNGGLAIHGGILFGFITCLIYCKLKKVKLFEITDIAVVSLIIAQAIGRWGNFFNSEAHGPVTSLENLKSMHIPNFIIDGMNIDGIYYHPTFFYESIWCLLGFILLLILRRFLKERKNGELTCVYLMWYSIGRFFIEQLRTDSLMIGTFKVAQLVSLSCFVIGLLFYLYLAFFKKEKKVK